MTMSEFQTLLGEIGAVRDRVDAIAQQFAAHVAVDASQAKRKESRVPLVAAIASCVAAAVAVVALFSR